jgi:DNA-binding transcriptional MerR regulator
MEKILRVAEVARELGCSERFLREADKKGKLPKARRDLNGWRVYTEEDLQRLRKLLVPSDEKAEEQGKTKVG